jgi:hypothetical protein
MGGGRFFFRRETKRCVDLTLLSLSPFLFSYGYEFLFETYLYHVTRKDHRHNFSFWFYNIYLTFTSPTGTLVGVLTFVPQLALVLAIGCCFGKDIFFCAFLQTFAFVAWNKVCTAQVKRKRRIQTVNTL